MTRRCLAALAVGLAPGAARAGLVLNEVCYDPAGADAGGEYVELFNAGDDTVSLDGARIEFANGAEGPTWRLQWQGGAGDRVAPHDWFLVADTGWTQDAIPDAVANLGLQNGPDAVRLVIAGGGDLLGYGALADPALFEGHPAAAATGGRVLARRPDGHDGDDNAADFVVADPTPGGANFPRHDLRLGALSVEPPSLLAAGAAASVTVVLANHGTDALTGATAWVVCGDDSASAPLPTLAAGAEAAVTAVVHAASEGRLPLAVAVSWPGSEAWRRPAGALQVGPAWVHLNEVMAAPPGGGEWIELRNVDASPRSLAGLSLRDEDGAWRELPDLVVAPGACAVLAEDPTLLRSWWDEARAAGAPLGCDDGLFPADRVAALAAGWPGLNDTPPASRDFADRVQLSDSSGVVLDHVTLAEGATPGRRSWERTGLVWPGALSAGWRPATAPAGSTPACPNSVAAGLLAGGGLAADPNPFCPAGGDGAVHLRFAVPPGTGGWQLRVYDLWGRVVRDLGGDDLGPGPRSVPWDGHDDGGARLPPGGYLAALSLVAPGGGVAARARRLVVVREGAP